MAGTTKGITIEFRGDTTSLGKALRKIEQDTKAVDRSLREVNRALRFNPGNTELVAQKQQLLKERIKATERQLKEFERTQKQLDDKGVEKTSQEYMEVRRRIIEAESKLKHFNTELKKIDYMRVEQLGKSLQSAGQKMRTAGTYATIAGGAMVLAGKKLLEFSTVQNQAENKLIEIYRTRMHATEEAAKSTMKLASAIQKEGIIGDEVTLSGAQQLATFAKYPETVNKILPAMDNLLAQQKGYNASADDAKNIANLLGKALQGQTGALSRVGITFTDAEAKVLKFGTEEEKAAMLAQIVTNNVGHMNKELAKTPEGKIQQAKNNIDDLAETLGNTLLPVLGDVAKYINDRIVPKVQKFLDFLGNHPAFAKIMVGLTGVLTIGNPILALLGAITSGIGSLITGVTKLLSQGGLLGGMISKLPALLSPITLGIGALIGILVLAYQKSAEFRKAVNELVSSLGTALKPLLDVIGKLFKSLFTIIGQIATAIGNALAPIIKALTPVITKIIRILTSVISTVLKPIIAVIKGIATAIQQVVSFAAPILEKLAKVFATVCKAIISVVGPVFKTVKDLIVTPIKAVYTFIKSTVSAIAKALNFKGIKKTVEDVFNAVKDKIWKPIKEAKDKISEIIEKIKKWFPIDVGHLITFTLPKIGRNYKVSKAKGGGSFGQFSWNVESWEQYGANAEKYHADGGIFTRPTLLPSIGGARHVVGEAGAEAILPLDTLWGKLDKMAANMGGTNATFYITVDGAKDPATFAKELVASLKMEMRS